MDELPAARSDDLILQLSAVARGLEDEGQLNLAKIFRAAAMGEIHRASRDRPRQGAGLEEAMRKVAGEMAAQSYASELLTGRWCQRLSRWNTGRCQC